MSATAKHQITGGDDLDDGLELDPELLADSGSEDEDGSINGEDFLEMTDEEDKGPRVTGQKRKASEDDLSHGQDEEVSKAEKKRRRKEKDKERRAKVSFLDIGTP
jgi:protein CMS1